MPDYLARYRIEGTRDFESDYGTVHPRRCQEFSDLEIRARDLPEATELADRRSPKIPISFLEPEIFCFL